MENNLQTAESSFNQGEQLQGWHKPTIMRIELARTLFGGGSGNDCLNDTGAVGPNDCAN